jgi:hypothetical protein
LAPRKEGESYRLTGSKIWGIATWKKDAWETLLAGVLRMKIPMPVWFGVVAPCMPIEASQKILGPTELCKHVGLGCGGICITGSSSIAMQ